MARPKTKSELLDLSKHNFNKLMDFIEDMDAEEQKKSIPKIA